MKLNKFEQNVVNAIMEEVKPDASGADVIPFVRFAKAIKPDRINDEHMVEIVSQVVIKKSTFNPLD